MTRRFSTRAVTALLAASISFGLPGCATNHNERKVAAPAPSAEERPGQPVMRPERNEERRDERSDSRRERAAPVAGEEQSQLVAKAAETARNFKQAPDLAWVRDNIGRAKAVLIVPQMLKGGFIVGGSGGSGVLLARNASGWSYPAFYTLGSMTFGLQIGGELSEIVLLVMTDKGMAALLTPEFKLGGDISVAAGPVGVGAKAQTADIIAFSRAKGLYGGLNIEGAIIAPRNDWNQAFYKRTLEPRAILIDRAVQNANANDLRQAVAGMGTQRVGGR